MRRSTWVSAALMASASGAAYAQTAPQAPAQPAPATAPAPQTSAAPDSAPAPTSAVQSPAQTPRALPAPASNGDVSDEPDIIVRGTRNLPGAVIGDIPPEQQLGPADIRSYGVSSVAELLTELAPQTYSGRGSGGAPVVLLNGKRISGFQEIRDLPTEAIARVDILPEEVALKYGYTADQRVVNIVLRRRFRAETLQVSDRFATDGGRNSPNPEGDILRIRGDNRFTAHLEYEHDDALKESERNIIEQTTPGGPLIANLGDYRTLLPSNDAYSGNFVFARPIGKTQASLNGRIEYDEGAGLQGAYLLPSGDVAAINRRTTDLNTHVGLTVNGDWSSWRWNLTGAFDRDDAETLTDGPFVARAHSLSTAGRLDGLVNGSLVDLPAGKINVALHGGGQITDFASQSTRGGVTTTGDVGRNILNGQLNVDVPLTSKSKHVLGAIGDLSANFNVAGDDLSDFGTLVTVGYGFNWQPVKGVRLIGSGTDKDLAPSPQQLGNPQVTTPNVQIYDYARGQSVSVTTVTGGNPGLIASNSHVKKLGLTVNPLDKTDLVFTANYVTEHVDNPVASFPAATAAIEAAYPSRFTRDATGTLTRLDTRPINFASSDRSEIRYGFNLSLRLKSKLQKQIEAWRAGTGPNPFAGLRVPGLPGGRVPDGAFPFGGQRPQGGPDGATPPPPPGGPGDGGPPRGGPGSGFGGGRGGFGGGGFGGGGAAQAGGRLQFAVYHTWHLTDRVLVQPGGPSFDLLNGDTIGNGGGQSRHEVEVQAGYANNGLGARLSANWKSGTDVFAGTAAAPQTLHFSDLGTINFRLFADFGQRLDLIKKHPWLRGMRAVLEVNNLFDARQRVIDDTGATPFSYQPGYLDPTGRTIRLSIRKLFFALPVPGQRTR